MEFRKILVYVGAFFLLIAFQVIILNNISISSLGITPFMYILFLVLLPFETPKSLTLFVSFFLGIFIDFFADTPGLNATATVFTALVRPVFLNIYSSRDGYESGTLPRIHYMGINWFAKYTLSLVISHHFIYYFVDIFSLSAFHIVLAKTILSGLFSTLVIVLSQFFIFRK